MTATPCIIAVPSIFIVAPNGMVNEDTSLETPISVNFSKLIGIVAVEVEGNAKIITGKNFLKNVIGFNLVNATSNDG